MKSLDKRLWGIAAAWLILVSSALYSVAEYASIAGEAGDPPVLWPFENTQHLLVEPNKPTLVMFAHPLCPCSRATLWELETMTHRMYGLFNTHVIFFRPQDTGAMEDIWAATDLKKIAQGLPGTTLHDDVNGVLASYFGAYTSGHVLLYDTQGKLQFAGGITPSRGHVGSNPGSASVISAILNDENVDPLQVFTSPVYGCSLHVVDEDDRKLSLPDSLQTERNELVTPL